MVNRIKTRLAREESGFTLIELLVVIIILGILLAIAIPSYLSFRDRANKTAAMANIRTVVPDVESYNADNTVGNTVNDPDGLTDTSHVDSGYTGMTSALLKSNYDQAFPASVFVAGESGAPAWVPATPAASTTNYCVVSTSGSTQFAYKLGPDGAIKPVTRGATDTDAQLAAKLCLP